MDEAVSEPFVLDLRSPQFVEWLGQFYSGNELFDDRLAGAESDPDGDGQENRFEFVALTDPSARDSKLIVDIGVSPSKALAIRPVSEGVEVLVQYSVDLIAWQDVEPNLIELNGATMEVDLSSMPDGLLYRAVVSRPVVND